MKESGEKSQEPYVSKELTPRVEGVVVLAKEEKMLWSKGI